jgi:hypothetical protein
MTKPAGYYNALFGGTPDQVRRLFEKYPVHPPDDADGYQGDSQRKIGNVRFTGEGLDAGDIDVARVNPTKPVAWLNFFKNRKTVKDLQVGNEGAHTLIASASYTPNPTHVPAYFLPWNTAGAVISLRIPRRGTRAAHEPDPDIFFTAAINGCSVFFDGPPDNPTVYHAGGSTCTATAAAGAQFWRNIMANVLGGGAASSEVNKTQYIMTDGVTRGMLKTTQAAKDYEAWLSNNMAGDLRIEDVNPWACVFGIRRGDNWEMWMQENTTVIYTVLKKKGGALVPVQEKAKAINQATGRIETKKIQNTKKTLYVDQRRSYSNPIGISKVYPGGAVFIPVRRTLPSRHTS